MSRTSTTFVGALEAVGRGGHAIALSPDVAAAIGAKGRSRVRGTIGPAPYRSNLVSMGGRLFLGVHKATVQAAGARPGMLVTVTMAMDREPLPNDTVPRELSTLLKKSAKARAAWAKMPPSHRRAFVGNIVEAKQADTRARRAKAAITRMVEWAAERNRPRK